MPDEDPVSARIWAAYRGGDAQGAAAIARQALERDPDQGPWRFALGCALERLGDTLGADRAFLHACRAGTDPVELPFRCSWRHFLRIVDDAVAAIPADLRPAFDRLGLALEDYASPTLLDGYDEPELLGLFVGTPLGEEPAPGELSPRIHLWRRAHEHACNDARTFADEVRTTLFHEFGHFLGYDEDGLERLGLG